MLIKTRSAWWVKMGKVNCERMQFSWGRNSYKYGCHDGSRGCVCVCVCVCKMFYGGQVGTSVLNACCSGASFNRCEQPIWYSNICWWHLIFKSNNNIFVPRNIIKEDIYPSGFFNQLYFSRAWYEASWSHEWYPWGNSEVGKEDGKSQVYCLLVFRIM